ncbi:MAG: fibronectin type III domain-containing protein [Thermoplasmata archaeon]|nr:fibronectin type III domain-containing protein [Thermoplasmata archaeon]
MKIWKGNMKRKIRAIWITSFLMIGGFIGVLHMASDNAQANWSIESVDSDGAVGLFNSLAVDINGFAHISYYDSTNDDLKHAKWTGSSWSIETIDSVDTVGQYTSIALDSSDNPHIGYYKNWPDYNLKYAKEITVPSKPQNLLAVAGDEQVTLTWTIPNSDGGSPITNYTIYRGMTSGGETLLTTVGNNLAYTDTGLSNGQIYYYKVSAVNSVGEGPKSNETSATPTTVPTDPPQKSIFEELWFWLLIGIILAIIIIVIILLVVRKKKEPQLQQQPQQSLPQQYPAIHQQQSPPPPPP